MSRKVIISCALTGSATLGKNSQYVPITPAQIAAEALSAANAGAAIVHIHVRDPKTGVPSMEFDLYKETVDRIRERNSDVIVNLTTGPGARYIPPLEGPTAEQHLVRSPESRTAHIVKLKPDICSLDVATMNFGMGHAMVNTPAHVKAMAGSIVAAGVKPELEVFDLGHINIALTMLKAGDLPSPPLMQFCMGITGGAPATLQALQAMIGMVPEGTIWSAFGIGRHQIPVVALATLLGGHVRVGLEDNLYLHRGELSKGNAPLVEMAATLVLTLDNGIATPAEARKILSIG